MTTKKTTKKTTETTIQAKTAAAPKGAANKKAETPKAETPKTETPKTETTKTTTPETQTAFEESALTLAELLWEIAPRHLGWDEAVDWLDYWIPKWKFHPTSLSAGRVTGPTHLYSEAAKRLQDAGYRVRRQETMGRSWLYVSR
jgi:hypothetical protein